MVGLAWLWPLGWMGVLWAGMDEEEARRALGRGLAAATAALIAWGISGFGFAFGGMGLWTETPAFQALRRVYTLGADPQPMWSLVGLSGFLLSGIDREPALAALWLHHAPAVAVAALLLGMGLEGMAVGPAVLWGAWLGGLVLPIGSHWVWGNGWLSRLGTTLRLGHGVVDPAGAGVLFVVTGGALGGILAAWGQRRPSPEPTFPPVHLPLLGGWGSLLIGVGWLAWLEADPLRTMQPMPDSALIARNAWLSALGAVLGAWLYTGVVARQADLLMGVRALAVGWVSGLTAAPFTGPWLAGGWGLLMGLATPILVYGLRRRGQTPQSLALLYGLAGAAGLLAVGLLANGQAGAGWNSVGASAFMGRAGLGVVGVPGWGSPPDPGQLTAQIVGLLALGAWGAMATGGPAALARWLRARRWGRSPRP